MPLCCADHDEYNCAFDDITVSLRVKDAVNSNFCVVGDDDSLVLEDAGNDGVGVFLSVIGTLFQKEEPCVDNEGSRNVADGPNRLVIFP